RRRQAQLRPELSGGPGTRPRGGPKGGARYGTTFPPTGGRLSTWETDDLGFAPYGVCHSSPLAPCLANRSEDVGGPDRIPFRHGYAVAAPCLPSLDDLRGPGLVRVAQDVGGVALVVGDNEVPVAGVGRRFGGIDLNLVDALRESSLEIAHRLGRLHRVGLARGRVERHHLGAEIVVRVSDIELDEGDLPLSCFPGKKARALDDGVVRARRLGHEGH